MRLSVLTFNTLGTPFFARDIRKRYLKIAEIIQNDEIDILCLQELFSHYNRIIFDKALSKYPYKLHKQFIFGVYGGLAIYSKLPIVYKDYHVYTYPKGVFIPPYTRLAHNGILLTQLRDIPLTIATTHLTSDVVHDLTPANRFYKIIQTQAKQAAEIFRKESEDNRTVMLTGDFNINKGNDLYKNFLQASGAVDTYARDNAPTYSFDRIPYLFPATTNSRIDYMFYKEGKTKLHPRATHRIFEEKVTFKNGKSAYLSDHIGLKAEFEISY